MSALDKPRQLFLRSFEWLRDVVPPAPEVDLSDLVLKNAAAAVRALPKLRLWAQFLGVTAPQLRASLEDDDVRPLVNLVSRLVRTRKDLANDELATLFVFLNAYHRAHPESSRPQLG